MTSKVKIKENGDIDVDGNIDSEIEGATSTEVKVKPMTTSNISIPISYRLSRTKQQLYIWVSRLRFNP